MAPLRRKTSEEKTAESEAQANEVQSTFDFDSASDAAQSDAAGSEKQSSSYENESSPDSENQVQSEPSEENQSADSEEGSAEGEAGKVIIKRKRIIKKTDDRRSDNNQANNRQQGGFKKGGMQRRPYQPRQSYGTTSYPTPTGEVAPEIMAAAASAVEAGDDNTGRPSLLINDLTLKSMPELRELATQYGFTADDLAPMKKQDLIFVILKAHTEHGGIIFASGALEILPDGYGFLRSPQNSYLPGPDDIYISPSQIRLFNLKTGDTVYGQTRSPKEGERFFALLRIESRIRSTPEMHQHRLCGILAFEQA